MKTTNERTAAQRAAIDSTYPQILCLAGPGSGKTTVLVDRIRRLIGEGVPASRICAITYTNAAAKNIAERLGTLPASPNGDESVPFVDAPIRLGHCGTLHSLALRCLRQYGAPLGYGERIAIIDPEASDTLLESKARSLGCKAKLDELRTIKAKGRIKGRLTVEETAVGAYLNEMQENGLVDLDLVLTEFRRLLVDIVAKDEKHALRFQFSHLLVDEVQDSARVDWDIYRAFPAREKFFVGDPDQSIYGFRGAVMSETLAFALDPRTQVLKLEENFRCSATICAVANDLIACNTARVDKATVAAWISGDEEEVSFPFPDANEGAEIAGVAQSIRDMEQNNEGERGYLTAVLCRTNAIAAQFRDGLKALGVRVAEEPRVELPPDWPLARALVELLAQPGNDTLAQLYAVARKVRNGATEKEARAEAHQWRLEATRAGRSLNGVWFGFPDDCRPSDVPYYLNKEELTLETRHTVAQLAAGLPEGASILDLSLAVASAYSAPVEEKEPDPSAVEVLTIHSAKGREWDAVFLVGMEDEGFPGLRTGSTAADLEEERRLCFVAVTRARSVLVVTSSATRAQTWGRKEIVPRKPSRFIAEMKGGAS